MAERKKKPQLPQAVVDKMQEAAEQRQGENPGTPAGPSDEAPAHILADLDAEPRPLAALPVLPLVGVQWKF